MKSKTLYSFLCSLAVVTGLLSILGNRCVLSQHESIKADISASKNLPGDASVRLLSGSELTQLIKNTDVSSAANIILLERARHAGLLQAAYEDYGKSYNKHPQGFYENLWRGRAANLFIEPSDFCDKDVDFPQSISKEEVYHNAEQCLEKAVQLRPHSALANTYLGYFEFWDGLSADAFDNYKQAVDMMRYALKIDPKCAEAHFCLGQAYLDQERHSSWYNTTLGLHEYQQAMKLNPTSSRIRFKLMAAAVLNGDKVAYLAALSGLFELVQGDVKLTAALADAKATVDLLPTHPYPADTSNPSQNNPNTTSGPFVAPMKTSQTPRPAISEQSPRCSVYVPIYDKSVIDQYRILPNGSLALLPTKQATCGKDPASMVVDPAGKYAYVSCAGELNEIWQYRITDGMLSLQTPTTLALEGTPILLRIGEKTGNVYAMLEMTDKTRRLVCYSVTSDGRLVTVPRMVTNVPSTAGTFVMDASERLLFVTDFQKRTIITYQLSNTTPAIASSNFSLPASYAPSNLTLHPSGQTLYVVSNPGGIVSCHISATGELKSLGRPLEWSMGFGQFVVDPRGNFGYALSIQESKIYPVSIASDGSLIADLRVSQDADPFGALIIDPETGKKNLVTKNTFPIALIADPTGRFLYLANGIGTISQYRIMTDGTFVYLTPSTLPILGARYNNTPDADYLLNPPVTLAMAVSPPVR